MVGFYMEWFDFLSCDTKCIEGKLKKNKWFKYIRASDEEREELYNSRNVNEKYYYVKEYVKRKETRVIGSKIMNMFEFLRKCKISEFCKETEYFKIVLNNQIIKDDKKSLKELLNLMEQYNKKSAGIKKSGKRKFKF